MIMVRCFQMFGARLLSARRPTTVRLPGATAMLLFVARRTAVQVVSCRSIRHSAQSMAWPFAGSSEQFEGHRYFLVKNSLTAAQHLILSPNTKKQVVVDSCKEPNEQYVMAYKDKLKSRYNEPHVRLNLPDIAEYCRILVDEDWTFLSTIGAQQTVAMQKEDESWQDAINAAVKKRSKQRKAASEYVLAHEEAEEYMVRMPVMPLLPSISAVNQIVYSRSIHRPMPVRCLAIFVARALHRTTIHQFCDFFR